MTIRAVWVLLLAAGLAPALAQDEAAPAKARPALIAPLAAKSTMLGITLAGKRLVAVGQRGHILLSDNGKDWKQVEVPVNTMLNRVRFRDDKNGWAVGHDASIVATVDGGQTWVLQHYDPEARALYDVVFLDAERLAAVGAYGSYWSSADNGKTWEAKTFPIGELGQHFNAAVRLADGSLLIVGERGLLVRSRDNGENWELLDSPYSGSFFGVLPYGDKGAIAYGLRGNIYTATDVSASKAVDPASYDPFTRETVPDAQALAKTGWAPLQQRPTTEGLFGGASDGATFLLVGVNGVAVRFDATAGTAKLIKASAETLNDVVRNGQGWLAVGRRGVLDLGNLDGTAGVAGGGEN